MMLGKTVWALLTTLTAAALLMSGGTAAAVASKSAAALSSCYRSRVNFAKGNTGYYFPTGGLSISTTSNCADINLRVGQHTFAKVCFLYKYCQANYTKITCGQWVVVATNVKVGVRFYFEFYNDAGITGTYAA